MGKGHYLNLRHIFILTLTVNKRVSNLTGRTMLGSMTIGIQIMTAFGPFMEI